MNLRPTVVLLVSSLLSLAACAMSGESEPEPTDESVAIAPSAHAATLPTGVTTAIPFYCMQITESCGQNQGTHVCYYSREAGKSCPACTKCESSPLK